MNYRMKAKIIFWQYLYLFLKIELNCDKETLVLKYLQFSKEDVAKLNIYYFNIYL